MFTLETKSSSQPASAPGLTTWIKEHPLRTYIFLTFGLTWPLMLIEVLGSWGVIAFRLTLSGMGLLITLFVAYGPTIAALIVTGMTRGRAGIRTLLGRLLIWRVGWQWYAAAILLPGVIGLGATALYALRGGTLAAWPSFSWGMFLLLPVSFLVRGIVNGEEIGWRGFALPHLQTRWNALTASLVLGGVWALFHLPIFFVHGASVLGSQNSMNPLAFLINVLAGAILMTWLFNNTQGSLLIAYLYHAAVNTWTSEIFRTNSLDGLVLTVLAVLIVVGIFGPSHLTRKLAGKKEKG
ncbi:MAG: CPBP family intramembrane metalloprotease [Chloroflexi bacterium]|nr:CPBP family intramembrane metalloprotease [Chloroflexota bacterium]